MMCGRKPKLSSSIASTLFIALTSDGLRTQSTFLDITTVRQMQFRRFRWLVVARATLICCAAANWNSH